MSRSITRGAPQRRPTVRRGPPKKSLGDRLIAALPLSEAALRRAEVRNFAARALGPVDPEALRAIAKILDEED